MVDALGASTGHTLELSEVLYEKAFGNPLAVQELLSLAARRRQRSGSTPAEGLWNWDVERIANIVDGDDVVDILLARLQRLSPVTQRWMRLAACLGNAFDLSTLAVVGSATRADAAHGLWEAASEGLVLPTGEDYRLIGGSDSCRRRRAAFDVAADLRHDRVQQAAYALVPDGEGGHCTPWPSASTSTPAARPGRARRADHRDRPAPRHRRGTPQLRCRAHRAGRAQPPATSSPEAGRASGGIQARVRVAGVPRPPLGRAAWRDAYDLAYDIRYLGAACAYVVDRVDYAEAWVAELLGHARTTREKAACTPLQLQQLTVRNRIDGAVAAGLEGLRLLGLRMSARLSRASILRELAMARGRRPRAPEGGGARQTLR